MLQELSPTEKSSTPETTNHLPDDLPPAKGPFTDTDREVFPPKYSPAYTYSDYPGEALPPLHDPGRHTRSI